MGMADIPQLASLMSLHGDWIGTYMVPPPDTGPGVLQLLTRQRARHLAGSGWYGVVLEAGEIRGQAALVPMPMKPERLEIVLWLEPAACGRGLGHRVVELLCEVAFEALDLPTVHARVRKGNLPMVRVFEDLGLEPAASDKNWETYTRERNPQV